MPTSNQQQQQQPQPHQQTTHTTTDTNNNNKITNGRSDQLVVGQTVILSDVNESDQMMTTDATLVVSSALNDSVAAAVTQSSLISSMKHHGDQLHGHHQPQQQHNHHRSPNNGIKTSIISTTSSSSSASSSSSSSPSSTSSSPSSSLLSSHISNNNIINNITNNIKHQQHLQQSQSQQQVHQQQQQRKVRSIVELANLIKDINFERTSLSNEELIRLVKNQQISIYKLESFLGKDNAARCVEVRRDYYRSELAELDKLDQRGINDRAQSLVHPRYEDLDYELVNGACCENVIGHVKVPVGLAGPLVLDGEEIFVPLATTEGCLVASTCRGLSALRKSGGVTSRVRKDFMTRAPIIRFIDTKLKDALDNVERAIVWLNDKHNKEKMRAAFNLTSSHGKFLNYTMYPVNREIHIRFEAQTGDAMGMNMCSKGVESALKELQRAFPTMEIVTLSGNMCTDKKAAGINWINGRGKSVECNAEIPAQVVQQVFKVSVDSMIDRWKSKVMVGSALAASIGGFNSQAANILTAIFIATGQDPAQNVTSSNCMLILEKDYKGSLVVCCTMPSIECGTVGGGTILADQSRYLQMMGVKGPTPRLPPHLLHPHLPAPLRQEQPLQQQQLQSANQQASAGVNGFSTDVDLYKGNNNNNNNIGNHVNNSYDGAKKAEVGQLVVDNSEIVVYNRSSVIASSSAAINLAPINSTNGYTNARKLARIVCATVMAAELSLLAALTEGTLVKSHMRHNRSSTNVTAAMNLAGSCASSISDL